MAKRPVALNIPTPTTKVIVELSNPRFETIFQISDPNWISLSMNIFCNGVTGQIGDNFAFPANATMSGKANAVRDKINELMAALEPGVVLSNADIQIMGLPT